LSPTGAPAPLGLFLFSAFALARGFFERRAVEFSQLIRGALVEAPPAVYISTRMHETFSLCAPDRIWV
jgi:hypothetical protein